MYRFYAGAVDCVGWEHMIETLSPNPTVSRRGGVSGATPEVSARSAIGAE
jgi:hypothetical protein